MGDTMKRVRYAFAACLLPCILLGGCAGVSVEPLGYNGKSNGEASGIRYYMPKPYLLVTELPTVQTTQTITTSGPKPSGKAQADTTPPNTDKPDKNATSTETNSTQASSNGSGTDLSYSAVVGNYQLKLIYLPDMSKQMAITMNAGLFGNVSAQPTLQDGWMLTSLQGSAVSDGSGALTALLRLSVRSAVPPRRLPLPERRLLLPQIRRRSKPPLRGAPLFMGTR
jgi:hypothetical protein